MAKSAIKSRRQGKSNIWITPDKYLAPVRSYFGGVIPMDPATEPDNPTRARRFYTKKDNGLIQDWGPQVFINPPFSAGELIPFLKKINELAKAGTEIIALLSVTRSETNNWQALLPIKEQNAECFVRQRIKFLRPVHRDGVKNYEEAGSNTQPSAFYGFNVDQDRFCGQFSSIGQCRKVENWHK